MLKTTTKNNILLIKNKAKLQNKFKSDELQIFEPFQEYWFYDKEHLVYWNVQQYLQSYNYLYYANQILQELCIAILNDKLYNCEIYENSTLTSMLCGQDIEQFYLALSLCPKNAIIVKNTVVPYGRTPDLINWTSGNSYTIYLKNPRLNQN